MKILILANSSSGLYEFRKELIARLLLENEVIAVIPDSGRCDDLIKIGCKLIFQPIDRRGINPITDFKLLFNYYKLIRKIKPDLVVTYTIKPNVYGGMVCTLLKVPYALNITGLGTAFERGGLLKKIVIAMYKTASKKSKVVFFENSDNRDVFINNKIILKEQACLLNGAGVNLDIFSQMDYPEGDAIKFLFMGRVMAEKGINELFCAMKQLISEGVKVELHVLGAYEEDYKDIIDKYIQEGWLYYHGYQNDVRPFINEAHCFVLPSWHEGMANTNLECAASGRPVITSNIPGCKEAVIKGVSGYLVESKNWRDLYNAMKHFIQLPQNERKKMGLEGRLHMERNFDKKCVVEETVIQLIM